MAICGDYDADGMTSTALLINALNEMGFKTVAAIPSRIEDGYGLNTKMISKLQELGVKLVITVDNGINAFEAIDLANNLNIDVIITDHHQIKDSLPKSYALIHPHKTPSNSEYKNLAGVGLAYILASTLAVEVNKLSSLKIALDLFCIGTIADMAPVTGFNRYLLKKGLKIIHLTECKGLSALYKQCRFNHNQITAREISFQIAPRINAVGRIGNPDLVLNLFSETDSTIANQLAKECDKINNKRRNISETIESEAKAILEADKNIEHSFILIAQSHWHPGVIGIVASRIVEEFNRPTALLAKSNDGLFRASVRSPHGFSVIGALEDCSSLLETFGGHPLAGGFTIKGENINELHDRLNTIADDWLKNTLHSSFIRPEAYLKLSEINSSFWAKLSELEPFGISNPRPLFWSRKCKIDQLKILKGGHTKFTFSQDNLQIDGIKWRARYTNNIPELVDIAFYISLNKWRNKEQFQLEIIGIKPSEDICLLNKSGQIYKCYGNSDSYAMIENSVGKKLLFSLEPPYNIIDNSYGTDSSYINSLKDDVLLAFGIVN